MAGVSICGNCGRPIWWDAENSFWRHDNSGWISCDYLESDNVAYPWREEE